MKKLVLLLTLAVAPALGFASSALKLDDANIDLKDQASLQRGAKYFVNYCSGCHSLKYMRYNRLGADLGLSDGQVIKNLMFTGGKMGDSMTIAMRPSDAAGWFGTAPPDLSVVARSRGVNWLYTYLRSFYLDESRPWGVNNTVFKDVGMPDVLWQLHGQQKAVYRTETTEHGEHQVLEGLELVQPGTMSPDEYDNAVRDLVNFLAYTGEPVKLERQRLGVWVLLFLAVFFVIAYLLKKEYWKDVH